MIKGLINKAMIKERKTNELSSSVNGSENILSQQMCISNPSPNHP